MSAWHCLVWAMARWILYSFSSCTINNWLLWEFNFEMHLLLSQCECNVELWKKLFVEFKMFIIRDNS